MTKTINLKKERKKFLGKREIIISVLALALTTAGIKASDTYFGSDSDSALCPPEMVFVPSSSGGFCIDRFEASPGEDCPNKEAVSQNTSRENLARSTCKPVSSENALPWVYISQTQAREACARAGKRLPTNKEWYMASLGTPDKNSSWTQSDCQVDNNWTRQPGETGSGENCLSSFGAYDMIGNIWEWTDEVIRDGKLNGDNLPEQGYIYEVDDRGIAMKTSIERSTDYSNDYFWLNKSETRAIARGGFYSNKDQAGIYSAYLVPAPSYVGVGVGFRCVK